MPDCLPDRDARAQINGHPQHLQSAGARPGGTHPPSLGTPNPPEQPLSQLLPFAAPAPSFAPRRASPGGSHSNPTPYLLCGHCRHFFPLPCQTSVRKFI